MINMDEVTPEKIHEDLLSIKKELKIRVYFKEDKFELSEDIKNKYT